VREANTKAPLRVNSVADSASLPLIALAPSAKNLCHEARNKAPLGANSEAIPASLEGKALHDKAKFASKGRTKKGEATLSGEVLLASAITRKKALKAKPKVSQPKGDNIKSSQVFVMDWLGPVNIDLRDYLSNKRKLRSEESIHISSSQCGQAEYQLVMVHSVHCCLGTIPTISSPSQQSVFNQFSARTSKRLESWKKATEVILLATASVNMISRERDLFRS